MKEYSYTSTPPTGRTACTEPQCLYKGCTLPLILLVGDCIFTERSLLSAFVVTNDGGDCTLNTKYHLKFRKINKALFVLVFF